jgi:hypothetical protein
VVAAILDPAEENYRLADVRAGELATRMSALDFRDEIDRHED